MLYNVKPLRGFWGDDSFSIDIYSLRETIIWRLMMYDIVFDDKALRDIEALRHAGDRQALKKIDALLTELELHPRTGTGKPKPLSGNIAGHWSRRITDKHRLVYAIDDDKIIVLVLTAARHYDD
ncbi:hypothetical protein FACS1894199_14970 [Bacteroidia bacterium]|nr:hypothetical protein FACS1894199_14970 [Bacteroidia bacterium]